MLSGTSTVWGRDDDARPQPGAAAGDAPTPTIPPPRAETWLATLARHRAAWRRRTGVTRYVTVGAAVGVGWGDEPGEAALAANLPGPLLSQHADWGVVPHTALAQLAAEPSHRAAATEGLSNRARGGLERWAQRARDRAPASHREVSSQRDLGAVACAFAEAGGFVLTGPRLAWLTRGCPGGLHVGLVSPRVHREDAVARLRDLTKKEAAADLERRGRHEVRWRRRGWPGVDPLAVYTLTCNTAHLPPEHVARVIAAATVAATGARRDADGRRDSVRPANPASDPNTPPPAG